jgi:CheY-like chemotaxis protein
MNGLLGMAQLLLTPNLSERERNDYARTILSSGQTLLTLLNDILDLSKIEAGKFQLDSIIFDPTSVISETQALFSGAAKSKNLQLDGNWQGPSGQRYQTDAHRLRQMLSNLVGNAIKFTPTGKVHLEATEIERNDAQALIEFSVTDSGIGIEADKLNLLFKPFSQTDSSTTRKYGGSGLGLSIVSHLARAMGGDVGVESQLGKGSRFWFRVKVLIVDIASESRQVQRSTVDTSYTDAQIIRGQVFVVEDNPVNRMVIDAMLSKLGTTQTFANDGQQALDAITSGARPDLILMDIHMPVMDGYAATQGIRQWETDNSKSRLPIIALTADAFEEDHQHCLAVGMDDFLSKPIVIESLKAALLQWLPKQAPISSTKATLDARELSPDECQQFSSLVSELIPLLTDNRFGSMTKLVEIQTLVKGSQLEADINDVDQILQSFRFDLALKRLRLVSVGATAIFT